MAVAKPLALADVREREDTHQSQIVPTHCTRDPMWDQHVEG